MALLYSLLSLRENSNLRLHVAHLNHNFRGDEADKDAAFVSEVARDLGLPSTVEKGDPVAYQRKMGVSSFEEAAREVRYDFLSRVSADSGAVAVALGHTADDLAETVIMHIIRGSGAHGLRGMNESTVWRSREGAQGAVLFRPLLAVTKQGTLDYCKRIGITFREDSGNRPLRFTRNRVRHELMPALKKYNPGIREALVRLAQSASLQVDYLEQEVEKVWPAVAGKEGDSIELDSELLGSHHPLIQRMVFRRAYEELAGDTRRLEESHLKAMESFVKAPAGGKLSLPRKLQLSKGYGRIILSPEARESCPFPSLESDSELPLPSSGGETITEVPGWRVSVRLLESFIAESEDPFTACFDMGAMGDDLRVRPRLPGDRFQPLGMKGRKKLQDFYVDMKVPRSWRDRVPLVVSRRGIAWVVGYRVAEWVRVREDSQLICRIRFSKSSD